jgi:hypothetical protein
MQTRAEVSLHMNQFPEQPFRIKPFVLVDPTTIPQRPHQRAPRPDGWYWAVADDGNAGDRFVVAFGQDELWRRVRREIDRDENCSWEPFGAKPTMGDCFEVWINGRERYGANYNRVTFELACVPSFRRWLRTRPNDICNYVSNACASSLAVQPYSHDDKERLAEIVGLG